MSSSPSTRTDEWLTRHDLPVLLGLMLLGFALLAPSLFSASPGVVGHPYSDVAREFFGGRAFGFGALARGVFPFWNPYLFGGTPYFANPQSALLYPLNLLFLALPVWAAINVTVALHLGLAASGTYLFGRSVGMGRLPAVLAGVVFGWSAHLVLAVYAGHLSNVCTLPWIPLSLAALERTLTGGRRGLAAVALAWAVALMVLAGHLQYVAFAMVGMAIYGGVRLAQTAESKEAALRAAGRLAAAGALGAAMVAVQVVPTFEFFGHSVRQAISAKTLVMKFRLPPENLATLVVPDLFGNHLQSAYWGRWLYWEMCLYVGLVPLGLTALALVRRPHRSVVAIGAMGATALVLALDGAIPGLGELLAAIPGFRAFRGYSKFIAILALALAVLAGWGLEAWMAGRSEQEAADRPRVRRLGVGLFVIAGAAALGLGFWTAVPTAMWEALIRKVNVPGENILFLPPSLDKAFLEQSYTLARMGAVRGLAVLAAFGAVLVFSGFRAVRARSLGWMVVLVAAADLAAFGMPFGGVKTPLERITLEPEVADYLSEQVGSGRLMTVADELLNRPLIHEVAFFGGTDTLIIERFAAYFNKANNIPVDHFSLSLTPRGITRLADLYAVSYLLRPRGKRLVHPHLRRVFAGRRHDVYRNLAALPRALVSGRVEVLDGRKAILEKLAASGYDPREALYVTPDALAPGEGPSESKKPGTGGTAEIVVDAPNQVVVEAALETAGYLYLADPAYPGWRVEVDGRPGRWFIANVCCRAVALPAGRHRVVFTFIPRGFALLAALSAAAWLGSLGLAVVLLRRPRP